MIKLTKIKPTYLLVLLNIVICFYFYEWFRNNINSSLLLANLKLVSSPAFCISLSINIIAMSFYGKRLSCLANINYPSGFVISTVGNAANNLFPFRLGELFRIFFSRKTYNIPVLKSLLLIFIERISDLIAIGLIGLIVLFNTPLQYYQHLRLLSLPFAGLTVALILIWIINKKNFKIKFHSKIEKLIETVIEKFRAFVKKGLILPTILYTFFIWIFTVISFYAFFKMSLESYSFSLTDAIAVAFFTTLSLAFSTVPSGIGFFEAGIVFYLIEVAKINQNDALAFALVFHSSVVLPQFLFFIHFIFSERKKLLQQNI